MRLKYFLRGVGIGIIVTTLILTITSASDRKMSDSEIIDRAIELGMSFSTSHSEESKETEGTSEQQSTTEPESTTTQQSTTETESTTMQQSSAEEESTAGQQSTTEAESMTEHQLVTEPQSTIEQQSTVEQQNSTEESEKVTTEESKGITTGEQTASVEASDEKASITCTISITKGMSSRTVCDMLKQNGIIADAADFDRYLIKTGYDDKIRVGEVEVSSDMTYEELTAILYKK